MSADPLSMLLRSFKLPTMAAHHPGVRQRERAR